MLQLFCARLHLLLHVADDCTSTDWVYLHSPRHARPKSETEGGASLRYPAGST